MQVSIWQALVSPKGVALEISNLPAVLKLPRVLTKLVLESWQGRSWWTALLHRLQVQDSANPWEDLGHLNQLCRQLQIPLFLHHLDENCMRLSGLHWWQCSDLGRPWHWALPAVKHCFRWGAAPGGCCRTPPASVMPIWTQQSVCPHSVLQQPQRHSSFLGHQEQEIIAERSSPSKTHYQKGTNTAIKPPG